MTEKLQQYLRQAARLRLLQEHGAAGRHVAERIREEMEQLWYELTPQEREQVKERKP